ncbi:MAG: hypothetical protein E6K78_07265 [Candidatus Eisenbacteria bacterium]|uniref:Peptidase M56 domain-containing protein n=1 Tax=Eiseniibacteriota bacterium TaxID=2212470 RepID=A0A538TQ08_UNCEI|nr:MAG: hypothetical protein E6K78_07265 [Candidatus Eisenbacteria bacterium]
MIRAFLSVLAGPGSLMLILKATVLLSLGPVLALALRRRSAAARHFAWQVTLACALALAALAPIAPRLAVEVPTAPFLAVLPIGRGATARESQTRTLPTESTSRERATWGSEESSTVEPSPAARAWTMFALLGALWLAGLVAVLLWGVLGHVGLWRLHRDAVPVDRNAWRLRFGVLPPRRGSAARARLGLSAAIGTPLTWGWLRPVILLPAAAEAWPIERRRAALLHEMAHVMRCDYVSQAVATLACAVYWFHPLAWWSAARLRSESEHACDDCVLAAGTPAPDYASSLLEVARGARAHRRAALAAVCMAHRSRLEGRLLAVLDRSRTRGGLPTRASIATLAVAAFLLVPFAGLEPCWIAAQAETVSEAEAVHSEPERSVSAMPGGRLELELETGGDVEIRAWDRRTVTVRSQLGGRDWPDTRVTVARAGNGVRVHSFQAHSSSSYSTSHRFVIRVPSRYDVRLRSSGGAVTIAGVEGSFHGSTGGGEMVLERASGEAELSTGGGDVVVSDSDLGGSVSTGGGVVRFSRVRGGLKGSSGSGPVIDSDRESGSMPDGATEDLSGVRVHGEGGRVDVPRGGQVGFLHIRKAGGDVNLEDAPQGAQITTGGGDIHVRRGTGMIDASTGGGDIEIGPITGSVSAGTGAGNIHVMPPSLDARVEVETAYTEGFQDAAKIVSAWSLDRDAVTPWDDHQGTPRRYVRAHGIAGNGHGLVRITTVNGDIELRRSGSHPKAR